MVLDHHRILAFCLALTIWSACVNASSAQESQASEPVLNSMVLPLERIEIPARRDGVIDEVHVQDGQLVGAEELLARMNDYEAIRVRESAELEREYAQNEAENMDLVSQAEAIAELARIELEITEGLIEKNAASRVEHERLRAKFEETRLEVILVRQKLAQAAITAKIKKLESELAQRDVDDRRVLAPSAGTVSQVFKHRGEWVEQGEPILSMLRLDRVRIQAYLDAAEFPPYKVVGTPVTIRAHTSEDEPTVIENEVLKFVGAEDESDGKYLIWVEVENQKTEDALGNERWLLRPGMPATITIHFKRQSDGRRIVNR